MICSLKGEKSHDLVSKALVILKNLEHRGACGCDAKTGDGAGITLQIPDGFLRRVTSEQGLRLPSEKDYAAGVVFLPQDSSQRRYCMDLFEQVVRREGQRMLGWRVVPTDNATIGDVARRSEPFIMQVFVGRGAGIRDDAQFERKLYVIRKVMERAIRESSLPQKSYYYVCSLSSRVLVYKGLLLADQIEPYYRDLKDPGLTSSLALVHQRYSTNTFPAWSLAQPFRYLCHNGEINTLRGNVNWMAARQSLFQSDLFGGDMPKLFPVLTPGASDSAILDNAVELLYHTGRSLPHAIMMLIPEAWQNHQTMSDEKKAFYEYHSCLTEPWDGPASIPFTDGQCVGAVLDRNGLRPSRYTVTRDGLVVMASETGVLDIDPAHILSKGRLEPGKMFLVDTRQGRIIEDEEIKSELASRRPYRRWRKENMISLDSLPEAPSFPSTDFLTLRTRQQAFGYTFEDIRIVMGPMARDGKEPIGSMGNDTPLAVLSHKPQLLYNYFRQLFAQVTNPPLDAIREELVTSLITNIGREHDLFQEGPRHCRMLKLSQPILTRKELEKIRGLHREHFRSLTLPIVFPVDEGAQGMVRAMNRLYESASQAIVEQGYSILILSDRSVDRDHAPIPALLAVAGLHHYLVRQELRTRSAIVIESGEPREVHHFCLLSGYGASAICPYLAFESLEEMLHENILTEVDLDKAVANYVKSIVKGLLKVMSKMGISTLHSYRGAQIFEAVGLNSDVIESYFAGTPSRIEGVGIDVIAEEALQRHQRAYPKTKIPKTLDLEVGGQYQWRRDGEYHFYNPLTIAKLQEATRENNAKTFEEFSRLVNDNNREVGNLRGLLEFKFDSTPVPIEEVEPWTEIVKRFKTGAMSYGSISQEAHETLAIAMNRLGGKSNTGEGGEDPNRFGRDPNGDWRRSAIKQVASGRFGVTINYLTNADEIQIKMAQGAKPGEGGQLPAKKVYPWIAKVRHSTPYVQLISPPPHHDIYSIEDLAQLIHDLKNANPSARINVKLVSEVGVGTIAAGVSKGKADVVLISGSEGGTGASPQTSIKHAGLPWELGLAETHQTLLLNDLRSRIVVECDGQLKTGRDVAIACLLGAEEFGFSTAPMITIGCIMMRKCHLNTCPVGVATQDPELRKKFKGKPEYVINYFHFIAEELRQIMAKLGFRTLNEMVGRVDRLDVRKAIDHWKARGLDFSKILYRPETPPEYGAFHCQSQDHGIDKALDHQLIEKARPALERGERVELNIRIRNVNRTVGTLLSHEIAKRYGEAMLPDDTIVIHCEGSAGQSFCAFGAKGIRFLISGDANDYFCKGLSGAKVIIVPPASSPFIPEENVLIGNVALYGATSGEMYARGRAGERFCVRNSGARAVVEGVGDHGCEYMTGGRAVILGPTGRNFAAGMSGGIAYVLDETGDFERYRCNREMVELTPVSESRDIGELREMIEKHLAFTGSGVAKRILASWEQYLPKFVKVMPTEYRLALERLALEDSLRQEELHQQPASLRS
jgi:glutamate synthase domain-containing protein 2/glutamate synthase domain-containing protein 1/glutamate synthase domain-containing protein 3